jgi:C-terminal processing protease CtpA/Prc
MTALLLVVMLTAQPAARPWLGMALAVRTSPGGAKFLYVGAVGPNTPAARADIRAGDIITHIGRRKPRFRDELDVIEFVSRLKVGQKLEISLVRAGTARATTIVVERLPPELEGAWKDGHERAMKNRAAAAP